MKKLYLAAILFTVLYSNAQVISMGFGYSIVLCEDGIPASTGDDFLGALGNGSAEDSTIYGPVSGDIANITAVSAGNSFGLYLDNLGRAWGCGRNFYGELGDGTNINRSIPVLIPGTIGFIAISTGDHHSLLLKGDGTVWSMGRSLAGEIGYPVTSDIYVPTQIPSLSGVVAISAGHYHSLFLKNDGTVWACGLNSSGQLANGNTVSRTTPFQCNISDVMSIATGSEHSLFVKTDGTAWAAGRNGNGQLGDNTHTSRKNPVLVNGLAGVARAFSNNDSDGSYFLMQDGSCMACGVNVGTIMGGTATTESQVAIPAGPSNIKEIAISSDEALFLTNDRVLWAQGNGLSGQLGNGAYVFLSALTQINPYCFPLLGLSGLEVADQQVIYPNPVADVLHLEGTSDFLEIVIRTVEGKTVGYYNQPTIGVSNLRSGLYLISWKDSQNRHFSKKFIKL